MKDGIGGRILTWLVLAVVPVLFVAVVSTSIVENRFTGQVVHEMTNYQRLEASRIDQALLDYKSDAHRLARATFVEMFTEQVQQARAGELSDTIGGQEGFDTIDPSAAEPLAQVADAIRDASLGAGTAVTEARVVDVNGNTLGQSSGYTWEPTRRELIAQVLAEGNAAYGSAFQVAPGVKRAGLITPITSATGSVVGALLAEVDITPIVESISAHRGLDATSEALLVQRGASGNVEYFTDLRFVDHETVPAHQVTASASAEQALTAPDGRVIEGPDYRGVESVFAIRTIEQADWGLVIRADVSDAFGISQSIRRLVLLGSLLAVLGLVMGWALLLRPLVRRVQNTALAAERVASGDYTSRIDDRGRDEVSDVARELDRLAADLEFDERMRNDAERRLRYQATHDELTNIFNRQHMTTMIRDLLNSNEDQSVSLLFLDLDDFKLVNDLWGHAIGDEVLAAVANRLRRLVGDDVLVSRWGGDEFTVALNNADQPTINALAHRVRSLFAQPVNTSVGPQPIACSVGVATAFSGDDLDQLLHDADAKMFEEKQANRKSRMIEPDTARLVDTALADGRIEVHYQPIVTMLSPTKTELFAVEALVRIRATDGSLRMPSEFLTEVLGHRYAREIDHTIAKMAMQDLAAWRAAGVVPATVSVALNLSPASMRDPGLALWLQEAAGASGIEPAALILELSEEADDLHEAVANELRHAGFRLAVDDLGLKRSNFDRLLSGSIAIAKLDRRWLDDPVVLDALIATCRSKGVLILAEGVETPEQLSALFDRGVRHCQGYLLARPMSAPDLATLLTPS